MDYDALIAQITAKLADLKAAAVAEDQATTMVADDQNGIANLQDQLLVDQKAVADATASVQGVETDILVLLHQFPGSTTT